jgi:hypothetical protein
MREGGFGRFWEGFGSLISSDHSFFGSFEYVQNF